MGISFRHTLGICVTRVILSPHIWHCNCRVERDIYSLEALFWSLRQQRSINRDPLCLPVVQYVRKRCLRFLVFSEHPLIAAVCVCLADKVLKQDREIREMKQKIAEVMAVSPGVSYVAPRHPVPQYLTKLLNSERYMLTPRALMYQCLKK